MREPSIDNLIRKALSTGARESQGHCPDENTAAAYIEHRLSRQDADSFEKHLAECSSCQDVLALALRLHDPDAFAPENAVSSAGKKVLFRFSLPLPLLGGAVAALILVVVFWRLPGYREGNFPTPSRTAELHAPVKPPVPGVESAVPGILVPTPSADKEALWDKKAPQSPRIEDSSSEPKHVERELVPPANLSLIPSAPPMPAAPPVAMPPAEYSPNTSDLTESKDQESPLRPVPSGAGGRHESARNESDAAEVEKPVTSLPAARPAIAQTGEFAPSIDDTENIESPAVVSPQLPMEARAGGAGGRAAMAGGIPVPVPPEPLGARTSGGLVGGMGGFGGGMGGGFGGGMGGVQQGGFPRSRAPSTTTGLKKIDDKEFYFASGMWIDRQCSGRNEPYVEIEPEDPEYKSILKKYKELRTMLPVFIYWNDKIYLLR